MPNRPFCTWRRCWSQSAVCAPCTPTSSGGWEILQRRNRASPAVRTEFARGLPGGSENQPYCLLGSIPVGEVATVGEPVQGGVGKGAHRGVSFARQGHAVVATPADRDPPLQRTCRCALLFGPVH